jgi:hypothetical protein
VDLNRTCEFNVRPRFSGFLFRAVNVYGLKMDRSSLQINLKEFRTGRGHMALHRPDWGGTAHGSWRRNWSGSQRRATFGNAAGSV